jgi:signal transduction histidine kinase
MTDVLGGVVGGMEQLVLVQVEDRLRTALHEIRQPVAAVLALAEAARCLRGATSDVRDYLDLIIEQVQEVSSAAWSVLDRRADGERSESPPVDVDEVLESVLASYSRTSSGTLTRRGARGPLWTKGSRPAVRRCLVNVIDNAVRAAGPTGEIVITVSRGDESVRIDVDDDGPGFGRVPTGTGIGLAVTRGELEDIGGSLTHGLPSGLGGARVAICLPLRAPDPADVAPVASAG